MMIDERHIIDWYDGIVQAVVRMDPKGPWYYCCLLAWNMEDHQKAFGLLQLSPDWSDKFFHILNSSTSGDRDQDWVNLKRNIQQFIDQADGEMLVIICRDLGECVIAKKSKI